jgi:ubiquitin-protein ligase E3 C
VNRQKTKEKWREEWDQHELVRTGSQATSIGCLISISRKGDQGPIPYGSAKECYSQMRLLLHFLYIHSEMDRARLAYFSGALQRTLEGVPSIATGDSWTMQLYRLSKLAVETLDYSNSELRNMEFAHFESLLSTLLFLSRLVPKHMARNAKRYYSTLAGYLCKDNGFPRRLKELFGEAVIALLTPITAETMTAYAAFGTQLLASPETLTHIKADKLVAAKVNYKMLTAALNRALEEDHAAKTRVLGESCRSLWLLAHMVYLHRNSFGSNGSFQVSQETDYIEILSTLLAAHGSEITHRIDILDEPMDDPGKRKVFLADEVPSTPLPPFVREQLFSLVQKDSIVGMMSQIDLTKSSQDTSSDGAQALATYALTLTRVFPKRASEIRMWLYEGSTNVKASTGIPAMIYFWHYSRSTSVFQRISKDHRNTITLLRPFLGLEKSMSVQATQSIQKEWRTLLLFLELYSFAITYMDDEEFLAGGQFGKTGSTQWGAKIRESSLPLEDVRALVIFLKNLAFALYWNSRDLQEGDTLDASASLGAYFGTVAESPARRVSAESDTSRESTRVQLRDLVTGLLRSVHQRE